MIAIEHKPKTYRARVNWYVCVWGYGIGEFIGAIELYDTRAEVVSRAAELQAAHEKLVVSGGWFATDAEPRKAIAAGASYHDYRAKPIPCLVPRKAS